jgi:hypothetical protein
LVFGLAATLGAAVSGACLSVLVIWIVGVGDTVAVGVRVLAVVRVVRERVTTIRSTVAVSIRAVRVGTLRVFLGCGQAIVVGIAVGVATVVRVEAVGHFPSIGETISIAICLGHIRSV